MRAFTYSLVLLLALFSIAHAQAACMPQTTAKTSLQLFWDPQPQPLGSTLTAYILERQTDTGPWVALPAPLLTATSAQDVGLQVGHTYNYRLSLSGRLSDGTAQTTGYAAMNTTSPPCVTILAPPLPLLAPGNFRATPQ